MALTKRTSCHPAGGGNTALNIFIPGIVKRSEGFNVIARAAYNGRERLVDERTGKVYDYSDLSGLEWKGIFAPEEGPDWAREREGLWNQVELKEDQSKHADTAQLARDFKVTLPHELNAEQRRWMVTDFCRELSRRGMVIDAAIHAPDAGSDE